MAKTRKELMWEESHIKNLIWSANNPKSLYIKSDVPRFEKRLKSVREKLRNSK